MTVGVLGWILITTTPPPPFLDPSLTLEKSVSLRLQLYLGTVKVTVRVRLVLHGLFPCSRPETTSYAHSLTFLSPLLPICSVIAESILLTHLEFDLAVQWVGVWSSRVLHSTPLCRGYRNSIRTTDFLRNLFASLNGRVLHADSSSRSLVLFQIDQLR